MVNRRTYRTDMLNGKLNPKHRLILSVKRDRDIRIKKRRV